MKVICFVLPILAFVNGASNTQSLNTKSQQQQQQFSSKSSQSSESPSNPAQYYSAQGSNYVSQSVPYSTAAQSSVYAGPVQESGQYQNNGIYAPAVEENYPPAVEEVEGQPYANQQVIFSVEKKSISLI